MIKKITIRGTDKWECLYCGRIYLHEEEAMYCRQQHNLILVPIAKEDLGRLVQFIFSKEDKLLNVNLIRILQRYMSQAGKN